MIITMHLEYSISTTTVAKALLIIMLFLAPLQLAFPINLKLRNNALSNLQFSFTITQVCH